MLWELFTAEHPKRGHLRQLQYDLAPTDMLTAIMRPAAPKLNPSFPLASSQPKQSATCLPTCPHVGLAAADSITLAHAAALRQGLMLVHWTGDILQEHWLKLSCHLRHELSPANRPSGWPMPASRLPMPQPCARGSCWSTGQGTFCRSTGSSSVATSDTSCPRPTDPLAGPCQQCFLSLIAAAESAGCQRRRPPRSWS